MQLTVRDASALLKLPEKSLYKLIKRNEIPHYQLNKSFFFNKAELLEWAIAHSVDISPEFFSDPSSPDHAFPHLSDAIVNGGIHTITDCNSKPEVLRTVVKMIPCISESESELIFSGLMARETLGTTAIGDGIAIPHVRNPIILNITGPSVLLCFLKTPIDFGALDGKKVTTIFTMISPTARIHLHLLARLSYLLQHDKVKHILSPENKPEDILAMFRRVENSIGIENKKGIL